MIGLLTGQIRYKKLPLMVVETNGIGYEVLVSMQTFYRLDQDFEPAQLFTHLIAREDVHTLYGFYDQEERALFRALLKISGVGPKVALSILSSLSPNDFVLKIKSQDVKSLVKVPGVGKKMAERLLLEMQDALDDLHKYTYHTSTLPSLKNPMTMMMNKKPLAKDDAMAALVALGYKYSDALKAVNKIYQEAMTPEVLLKAALKQLVGNA